MTDVFFKKTAIVGWIFSTGSCMAAAAMGRPLLATGIMVGASWIFLNLFFLFRLIEIGMKPPRPGSRDRIFVFSAMKFPLLYVAGFFILQSRFFPIAGILAGLTFFVLALIGVWIRERGLLFVPLSSVLLVSNVFASEESSGGSSLHILNAVHLAAHYLGHSSAADFLLHYENLIFGVLVIFLLSLVFWFASRSKGRVPGRLAAACEFVVEGLENFVCGILGPEGKRYTPFLGTLFLYILTMNWIGLVPLMKAPTANSMIMMLGPISLPIPTTTAALAIVVFFYVQSIGIRRLGLGGYLDHMAGSPRDVFGFVLLPLMFVIHVIGEFAKPLSLAFRLYGNIWGEDVLLAVFMGLGVGTFLFLPVPSGVPIHFPFLLLAIVTGTIQAFVFTLLST